MALPAYTVIYQDITTTGSTIQQQIIVSLWFAINAIRATPAGQDMPSVNALAFAILADPQLVARVGFRIMSTVLAAGNPTDATIQSAVTGIIPATGAFTL